MMLKRIFLKFYSFVYEKAMQMVGPDEGSKIESNMIFLQILFISYTFMKKRIHSNSIPFICYNIGNKDFG